MRLQVDAGDRQVIVNAKNLSDIIRAWAASADEGMVLSNSGKPIPIPFPAGEKVFRMCMVVANGEGGHAIRPLVPGN